MLRRDDGVALLYAGRIHTLIGKSGAGKTWLAYFAAAQEIEAGNHVLWMDFEDDETTAASRLLSLRVAECDFEARFHYHRLNPPLVEAFHDYWADLCHSIRPTLIVIDATAGYLSGIGIEPTTSDSGPIEDFHDELRKMAAWYGTASFGEGAAVLAIDHPAKGGEGRTTTPIGSERKVSGLNGAAYSIKAGTPFGEARSGAATVELLKDRRGRVSKHQNAHGIVGKFVLDSHDDGSADAYLSPPRPGDDGTSIEECMRKASTTLQQHPSGMKQTDLIQAIGMDKSLTARGLARLEQGGYIRIETIKAPGSPRLHTSVKPYPDS